jgi:hypothetical protein
VTPFSLSRLHGGLLGALVALLVLAGVAFSARVLHAPPRSLATPTLRGPHGFVTGWQRDGDLEWNVLSERSAHHSLVVRVEMRAPERVGELAARFVPLVSATYGEVLIYAYRPARGERIAERRIQWTRDRGYDELIVSPDNDAGR